MYRSNSKSVALPVPEIIGGSQKIRCVGGREWYRPKARWWVPIVPSYTFIPLSALVSPKLLIAILAGVANFQIVEEEGRP